MRTVMMLFLDTRRKTKGIWLKACSRVSVELSVVPLPLRPFDSLHSGYLLPL